MTIYSTKTSRVPPLPADHTNGPFLTGATLAEVQRLVDAPPASLALLAAINDCMTTGDLPHPIQARRVNVVDVWQRWMSFREVDTSLPVTELDVGKLDHSFARNVQAIEDALNDDPIWHFRYMRKPDDINYHATILTAPLMFWHRPHVLIELTPSLEGLLDRSDLGDDLPLDQLRPPLPACYIKFGDTARGAIVPPQGLGVNGSVDGAYVFEARNHSRRTVTVVGVGKAGQRLAISSIELNIDNERRPINDLVASICKRHPGGMSVAYHYTLVQICMKVFMYWNSDQALRREDRPYTEAVRRLQRLGPKKAVKIGRHADRLFDRVVLGPNELLVVNDGARGEKQTHWRRGHFRMQPHGPQLSLRKVIFIAPVLVRGPPAWRVVHATGKALP